MRRATLKNLLAHKLRMALTTLSVVLGVAFVSGTLVLTDTMNAAFTQLFGEASEGTDVAVRAEAAFSTGDGGDERSPIAADLVDAVAAVPGVVEAAPVVDGYAAVLGSDGEAVDTGEAPQLGTSWVSSRELSPLQQRDGRAPQGPGEVAVDVDTAEKGGLEVGDTVTVLLKGPAQELELVGTFSFGDDNALAGASMVAFETTTAQELLLEPGQVSRVVARAEDGVAQAELAERVQAALPAGLEALTGEQLADESASSIAEGLAFFSYFLLTFAAIAVFVGSFIIFNTFTMLVAQRTREIGLLRAVGASRGQVTRSVLLEALVVGVVGSVVGLLAGIGLAYGLRALISASGGTLPEGPLTVAPATALWAFAVGVGVTTVAALLPARRAARISPVEAITDRVRAEATSSRRRAIVGALLAAAGGGALTAGLTDSVDPPVLYVGIGVALVFLAVTTLAPFISRPVVRLLALPLPALFPTTGRLARENALRNPRRTSATAGALMIGLALVSTFTVLGTSLKASFTSAIEDSMGADYVLNPQDFAPISTDLAARVAEVEGVESTGSIRWGVAKFGEGDGRDWIAAVQPEVLDGLMTVEMVEGSGSALARDQLLVSRTVAESEGWEVGQELPAEFAATGATSIVLGGTYEPNFMAGDYLISTALYERSFTEQLDGAVMVRFADAADPAAVRERLEQVLVTYPNVDLMDMQQFTASQQGFVDGILMFVNALLALSILIALFGVLNTLALSVFERTHEIGLLRAVGMGRRQLRRTIRYEAGIIATFGAVLGLTLGVGFGWSIVTAMGDLGVTHLAVPLWLPVYVVVAALAGVLAAVWPAWRAGRMNVLGAIATT